MARPLRSDLHVRRARGPPQAPRGLRRGRLAAQSETIRVFAAASDKLDPPTFEGLQERFGARVVQLYGMSETAPHIAATPFDGSTRALGLDRPGEPRLGGRLRG